MHADVTAAKGMVERRGISRVRHIVVDHLWIQDQEARRMLPIGRVDGGENPADLMIKNVKNRFPLEAYEEDGLSIRRRQVRRSGQTAPS